MRDIILYRLLLLLCLKLFLLFLLFLGKGFSPMHFTGFRDVNLRGEKDTETARVKSVPTMSATVFARAHAFVARVNMMRGRVMSLSKQGINSIVLDGGANLHI